MTLKTLFVTATLALAPALASAECQWKHETTASQCAEGQVFDAKTGTCVAQTTS
ncbi:MAG: hypothetical protein CL814_13010 [Confluentimicrobium sp.]|jgi:hypothetical protein|uniref:chitin-binding domain-containing protein n=1 Tax=Actibacterium sp. TaxID=1872125 RepID=UPI000AA96C54|nr:chitin-binding domain-containing protein [Actibacterium sp.]MBC57839.1 hypothetical protein [Actibacterium sp.]MDY6858171.1 hypothetical protein [Pseudomonadota bacterium]|tara:strand:+ start:1829 stop:1990 length:162 start_codon:yes stop_codon:yes gene_type:complete